nr:hypothetical protein [uncultured Rhodopila sp.]
MRVDGKIIGFDHKTELAVIEEDIPAHLLMDVMRIADVPDTDPELLGCYPLTERQIADIAKAARISIDPEKFEYFLEGYAEQAPGRPPAPLPIHR